MNNKAKFLLMLDDDAQRALLFDHDRRLLGEVIEDDGYIVDTLLAHARRCPVPDDGMLRRVVPPPPAHCAPRCFML
jgi:hypothetical protein